MREIKFDLIYQGETRFHHKKYYLSELMNSINKICDIHHMMNLVAKRQYTGLKDKDGVEVYEGDIVEYLENVADGQFIDVVAVVDLDFAGVNFNWATEFKIIGNIYENPELLDN